MLNKSPLNQYQTLVSSNEIAFDAAQQEAIELLQQLYLLLDPQKSHGKNIKSTRKPVIKGIYLWGKVGRGKTFLMDVLVNSLSSKICKRQHFHHFMQSVHYQLQQFSGKPEPLKQIAQNFSQQYRVLCFDEFFVSDIGDAMLLGNLLQFMFEQNIVVVSTSNSAPNELYRNGLQRERFLPAITAIERHCYILHLNGELDHRHRRLTYAQNYFELLESEEQQITLHQTLLTRFNLTLLSDIKIDVGKHNLMNVESNTISILGREIKYIAKSMEANNKVICFEFADLCQGARSHFDYLELAKIFDTILLFNVPPMSGQTYERIKARGTEDNGSNINVSAGSTGEREVMLAPMDDAVRRFIALVDECYDCHLNLFITAYVPKEQLYNCGSLMFEFERTKSRLIEMASVEYRDKNIFL